MLYWVGYCPALSGGIELISPVKDVKQAWNAEQLTPWVFGLIQVGLTHVYRSEPDVHDSEPILALS